MDEPWYKWACEQLEAINNAGLGAKVNGDAPSQQVLTAWLKAMGIRTIVKEIDVCNLLINKDEKNENLDSTGNVSVGSDTNDPPTHPNKSVGVENNGNKNSCLQTQKRKQVKVHFIDPKCLPKIREIMDSDSHEREDELITQIVNAPTQGQKVMANA